MTRIAIWIALVVALLTPISLCVEAFQQPTAVLTGKILSDDGQPVNRAVVAILGSDKPGARATVTDSAGEFSVDGLPAGSFTVWAAKAGFLTSYYGSKNPGSWPPTPIALAAAQRGTVSITMVRGGSIAGRITDPSGQPVGQALVQVREITAGKVGDPLQSSKTDAEGGYRIVGLAPGKYIVEALPPPVRNPQAVFTAARAFFPGVAVIDQAAKIEVSAGLERDDVSFKLMRTARVSGKVAVPGGQPVSGISITMISEEPAAKLAPGVARSTGLLPVALSDTGEFSVQGVAPGTYALWARWDAIGSTRGAGADTRTLWGTAKIVVDGSDVSGVVLDLMPGVRISGTIRIDPASKTPAMETLRLRLSPQVSSTAAFSGSLAAAPDPSGGFVFPSVPPGLYDLRTAPGDIAGSPADTWVITAAVAAGHEVADATLDIRAGAAIDGVVVALTETEISGTVVDGATWATARFPILFYSVDRSSWTQGSRRLQTAQPSMADNTFRVGGLPPGEYFVVAAPGLDPGDAVDAVYLEQLAGAAITVSIASGEKRRVDLAITNRSEHLAAPRTRPVFPSIWAYAKSTLGLKVYEIEGLGNSPAGQLGVAHALWLAISQRGDKFRIASYYPRGEMNTVECELNGQPLWNPFFLVLDPAPSAVTCWWQEDKLVSTIDVFRPGDTVPRHYLQTISIGPEGTLALRIERAGFPDTLTGFFQRLK